MANGTEQRIEGTDGKSSRSSLSSGATGPNAGHAHHDGPAAQVRHADARVSNLIFTIVGGLTALLVLIVGIVLLTGVLLLENINEGYRTTLGIVMVVYGTYRLIMLWLKYRRTKNNA